MKIAGFVFCALLIGATTAQAELLNRRKQCDKWEYIPASEQFSTPDTALLFCTQEDKTWMALKIQCLAKQKRMAVAYRPGFDFAPTPVEPPETVTETADEAALSEDVEFTLIDSIPLESEVDTVFVPEFPDIPREMVFLNFQSFGYTSVAYFFAKDAEWKFFEPEPMSQIFAKLISGNFADFSLLATETTERFPLKGSGKALRPVVEACRLAKKG